MMQPFQNFASSSTTALQIARPVTWQETGRQSSQYVTPVRPAGEGRRVTETKAAVKSTAERLFMALVDAKSWTSNVSMYLDRETRDRIFRQLDILHDAEEWFDEDRPVALPSFKSMIRAIVYHDINCRPALSIMPNGNMLALWQDGTDKLTVEFLADNRTRWLVQSHFPSGPERASGTAPLERLRKVLAPYGAARWFDGR